MRYSHPGCFLWLSSSSSIFSLKCFIQEGAHPDQPGKIQDCFSTLSASLLLHPHMVLTLLAVCSFWSLLTWWQSIKSPGSSFMNSYKVAFFDLDFVQWILVIHPWACAANSYYPPKYRILHLSLLYFNVLISILFRSLSRPFSVFMLSSIMLTLLSIELSTNLISIPYMIFSFLCQFQLGDSWFFQI